MTNTYERLCVLAALGTSLLACGCGGGASSGETTGPGTSTGEATTSAANTGHDSTGTTAADATTAAGSTTESSAGAGNMFPKLDVGGAPDIGVPPEEGCNKVDFLFVIDNSSSMEPHQANLVANFPGFISGIEGALDSASDYQVGVITTDAYAFNVPQCQQLGALVVQTGGASSSNMACGPYDEGFNFMTDEDDLVETFSCAAEVGSGGSGNEQPMLALANAVTRAHGDNDECNEGFLRDDSLLVVVIIGNENDNSPGTPMEYYQTVLTARSDIPENVVVMAITDSPGNPCGFGASVEVSQFTQLWGANGFIVPFCDGDYGPFFAEAVGIIDAACENFMPPPE